MRSRAARVALSLLVVAGCTGKNERPPPLNFGDSGVDAGRPCESDLDCGDGDPCTEDACKDGICTNDPYPAGEPDRDRDGWVDAVCGGEDCDDDDPDIPAEVETCNGLDDDCNGLADDGLLGGGEDVEVSTDVASNVTLAAAHGGTGYGVLWVREGTWDLTFRLLDADGNPLGDIQPIAGQADPSRPGHVGLTGIPGGYFAAWGQEGEIRYSIVDAASGPSAPGAIQVEGQTLAYHVDAAYSGAVVGLAWVGVVGASALPTWVVVDPDGTEVGPPESAEPTTPETISIEWIGDVFAVLYEGSEPPPVGGKMLLLGEDGVAEGPAHFSDTRVTSPSAAWEETLVHVAWHTREPVAGHVRTLTDLGVPVTDPLDLGADVFQIQLASRGLGTLLAWIEGDDRVSYQGALRAAVLGAGLVGEPIEPNDDGETESGSPSLVADETGGFAVAFAREPGGIYFDRIDCR